MISMARPGCWNVITLLSLASGLWLVQAALPPQGEQWSALGPQAAQAYVARANVAITYQSGETYEAFVSRAEAAGRAAVQRSFDRDVLVTEVAVVVVAQSNGTAAPVLGINVTRNQWRNRPDPQRWATYFRSAKTLLGFDRPPIQPNTITPANAVVTPDIAPPPPVPGSPSLDSPGSPGSSGSPSPASTTPAPTPTGATSGPGPIPTPGLLTTPTGTTTPAPSAQPTPGALPPPVPTSLPAPTPGTLPTPVPGASPGGVTPGAGTTTTPVNTTTPTPTGTTPTGTSTPTGTTNTPAGTTPAGTSTPGSTTTAPSGF